MTLANRRAVGFVLLTLEFRRDQQHRWLGRCRELGTATDGRSFDRVKSELMELVELQLNELEGVGERNRFFRENGIKFYSDAELPHEVNRMLSVSTDESDGAPLVQVTPVRVPQADRELVTA